MEELRSTEILDREIEADARKKAEKILARADEECKNILAGVDERVKKAKEEKEAFYSAKIEKFEKSIEEAFPLEKERFLVSFYSDSVSKAFNDYLDKAGSQKRLALIEKKALGLPENIKNTKLTARVFGYELSSAKKMLEKVLTKNITKVEECSFEKSGEVPVNGNNFHEGIILESEDKYIRVRLTMDQLVREIKDKYSNELALKLFGGRLPE